MKDPTTKADILDRLLRMDFKGNLGDLGQEVRIERLADHVVRLTFPQNGKAFDLTVHMDRSAQAVKSWRVKKAEREAALAEGREIPRGKPGRPRKHPKP